MPFYRTTQPNLMMDVNAGLSQPSEGVRSIRLMPKVVFQGISDTFIRQLNDLMQMRPIQMLNMPASIIASENFNMIVQDPNLVELLTFGFDCGISTNIGDCFPSLSEEKAKKFEKVFGDMTQNFVLKTFKVDCEKCRETLSCGEDGNV